MIANRALLFLSSAPLLFFTEMALAQSAPRGAAAPASELQDIVVTATRRATNIQDVPFSITAVTGDQLADSGVVTTRDLEKVSPGLVFATTAFTVQPTVRGIGTRGTAPGDESNVPIYIDGIYQPAMTSNLFELQNIERVEVLRGPQGTLFGRNATGGAINVVTRKPADEATASVSASYGRYDELKLGAYVTGPLAPDLSADLALQYSDDDGYVRDLVRNKMQGANRSYVARGRLRWTPGIADLMVGVSYVDVEDNSSFTTQPLNGNTRGRRTPNQNVLIPKKARQIAGDFEPTEDFSQFDVNLLSRFDFGPVALEATFDYQRNKSSFQSDSDSTLTPGNTTTMRLFNNAWSHEIRLLSQGDGRFEWVIGGMLFGANAGYNPLVTNGTSIVRGRQKTFAYAGFGEATFEAIDNLFLTGGLRYSGEKKTFFPFVGAATMKADATFHAWTPRASIRYQFNEGSNIYFTYSKGFKSGLFNSASSVVIPVQPEKIEAFEVGLKVEPTSWMRANLSAFHYDYTDLQVQARNFTNASITLQNAASAKVKGIDVDVEVVPFSGFDLRLSGEYLDSKYTDFPLAQVTAPSMLNGVLNGGNDQVVRDVSGNELIRAPKWSGSFSAGYEFDISQGRIRLAGNISYNDGYWLEVGNRLRQPSYTTVDASITWKSSDDRYSVSLWGRNITSEKIYLYALISGNGDLVSYRKPATYGISATSKF